MMPTEPIHDQALLERLQHGDHEAFRLFVEQHQSAIVNGAMKFVRNVQVAEDITQEVFLEVFQSIHAFRGDARLTTWTYRIMIAKSLNWIRMSRRKRRFARVLSIFDLLPGAEPTDGTAAQPLVDLEQKERAELLTKALERLPERQRAAVTMSQYMELSHAEIADILGVSIGSVEALIHRGKQTLRKLLAGYYQDSK